MAAEQRRQPGHDPVLRARRSQATPARTIRIASAREVGGQFLESRT
ncbi:MAG: hypothetical protein K2X74_07830 [Acetobacteraceae bacterium]|nr:hypothetical protein [Acetobacteraceae bacterium]